MMCRVKGADERQPTFISHILVWGGARNRVEKGCSQQNWYFHRNSEQRVGGYSRGVWSRPAPRGGLHKGGRVWSGGRERTPTIPYATLHRSLMMKIASPEEVCSKGHNEGVFCVLLEARHSEPRNIQRAASREPQAALPVLAHLHMQQAAKCTSATPCNLCRLHMHVQRCERAARV